MRNERAEVKRPSSLSFKQKALVIGGLVVGTGIYMLGTVAGNAGHNSLNRSLKTRSQLEQTSDPLEQNQLLNQFYEQNDHTRDLGELEHDLRLVGGATVLLVGGIAIGMKIRKTDPTEAVSSPEPTMA